jgi:hypothetical protein
MNENTNMEKTTVESTSTEKTPSAPKVPAIAVGLAVAVSITLLSGIAHGVLDGRWSAQADQRAHGAKLNHLAETCGAWKLSEEKSLDESAEELLRCYGSTVRDYVNSETGDRVSVAVLFGPRGPTAIHIPEICFDSVGTDQVGDRREESINLNGKENTFWSVMFSRDGESEPSINIWYAWSDGGEWIAGNYPRFWMTETLYKVQVSGPVGDGKASSPCRDFLTAFLPHLEPMKSVE